MCVKRRRGKGANTIRSCKDVSRYSILKGPIFTFIFNLGSKDRFSFSKPRRGKKRRVRKEKQIEGERTMPHLHVKNFSTLGK
jgi:hypothetical protein